MFINTISYFFIICEVWFISTIFLECGSFPRVRSFLNVRSFLVHFLRSFPIGNWSSFLHSPFISILIFISISPMRFIFIFSQYAELNIYLISIDMLWKDSFAFRHSFFHLLKKLKGRSVLLFKV